MNEDRYEVIGYVDHEGYVWSSAAHAADYFEGKPYSLRLALADKVSVIHYNGHCKSP